MRTFINRQVKKSKLAICRKLFPLQKVSIDGFEILVDCRDPIIGTMLWSGESYESEVFELFKTLPISGKTVLDIGANLGLQTLRLSRCVGGGGRVIAFEPNAHNYYLLDNNIRANKLENIKAHQSAVGAEEGDAFLSINSENYGDHRIVEKTEASLIEKVRLVSIDNVCESIPSGEIAFIKMDVQGSEHEVIRGMTKTLIKNPDVIIFLELFPQGLKQRNSSASELLKDLASLRFMGFEFHSDHIGMIQKTCFYETWKGVSYSNLVLCRNEKIIIDLATVLGKTDAFCECQPTSTFLIQT